MGRLDWASIPSGYEVGVSNAVLYSEGEGLAWNGLMQVDEGASGTQNLDTYFDGRRLVIIQEIGDFEASVQAFTYPDELEEPGIQRFGLSYRTQHSAGDKIHIVYNALFKPPDQKWSSVGATISPSIFAWSLQASAVNIPGARPSSRLIIDTADTSPELVELIEGWLYGTPTTDPRLPDPEELVDIFEAATTLRITQNGDGTYTATGPDHIVVLHGDGSFTINAPTLQYLDVGKFVVDSF
ncbi:MAG TPA: hypothetical protein PKD16_02085 [Saprospiraceae bacterium]|jgi:hypothetical protein|nr:hypothetical protein [Saprospiraceae bacterium]